MEEEAEEGGGASLHGRGHSAFEESTAMPATGTINLSGSVPAAAGARGRTRQSSHQHKAPHLQSGDHPVQHLWLQYPLKLWEHPVSHQPACLTLFLSRWARQLHIYPMG